MCFSPDAPPPTWEQLEKGLVAVKTVVHGLVDFIQNHSKKGADPQQVSLCNGPQKKRGQALCVVKLIRPLTEGHSLTSTIINTSMIRLVEMHFEAVQVCGEIDFRSITQYCSVMFNISTPVCLALFVIVLGNTLG